MKKVLIIHQSSLLGKHVLFNFLFLLHTLLHYTKKNSVVTLQNTVLVWLTPQLAA